MKSGFNEAWESFSDISINDDDEIEQEFEGFEIGTDRFEIWHWFEEKYDVCLGEILY